MKDKNPKEKKVKEQENIIVIGDFQVHSAQPLAQVEKTMNKIIKKHTTFLNNRRRQVILENSGYVG